MGLKRFLMRRSNIRNSSMCKSTRSHIHHLQKRKNNNSSPTPSLLKQLQLDSREQQTNTTQTSLPPVGDDGSGLFTRTLITPTPFNRYHHLWLHKTLTNEKRIKNLPIPTPNHKTLPIIICIVHHIISNGPSTLESLWRGLRTLGIIKSKRRLKKTIKKYIEKYPDSLPFVNLNTHNQSATNDDAANDSNSEIDTDTESDMESGSESDSDYHIESDFSESDSAASTDWDSDGLQPSIYGIRPEKKEKIIAKYEKKWNKIESDIESGKIQLFHENTSLWWYSVHEHGKPVAKGPILWEELMERLKSDKKSKGPLNKNKVLSSTPVFNFAHMDHWRLLSDVIKQF